MRRIFITLMVGMIINAVVAAYAFSQVGIWVKKQDMPTARYAMASAVVNGNIYVIGGWGNNKYLDTVEMYDPKRDRWETKASISQGNLGVGAAVVNGKIYAIGGWNGGANSLSTVEEYDPVKDSWTRKADMPTARNWVSAVVVDGIIYAIGGATGANFCSIVEAYNPATDQWSRKANFPLSAACYSAAVGDKIYSLDFAVICGAVVCCKADVYEYDPTLDTWTRKTDMPTSQGVVMANGSALNVNDKIYVIGGELGGNRIIAVPNVEIYNRDTDKWEQGVDLPNARAFQVASVIDGKIYIIGGVDNWPDRNGGWPSVLPTVEVFDTGLSVSPQGRLASKWGEIKGKL